MTYPWDLHARRDSSASSDISPVSKYRLLVVIQVLLRYDILYIIHYPLLIENPKKRRGGFPSRYLRRTDGRRDIVAVLFHQSVYYLGCNEYFRQLDNILFVYYLVVNTTTVPIETCLRTRISRASSRSCTPSGASLFRSGTRRVSKTSIDYLLQL